MIYSVSWIESETHEVKVVHFKRYAEAFELYVMKKRGGEIDVQLSYDPTEEVVSCQH